MIISSLGYVSLGFVTQGLLLGGVLLLLWQRWLYGLCLLSLGGGSLGVSFWLLTAPA